jgi:hypothetical protein
MVSSAATTVADYLAELTPERQALVEMLREAVVTNLPEGYEERMQYGMISYVIPLERYPKTYNGQPLGYISLGAQKNYVSLYLMGVYGKESEREWFLAEWDRTGKRFDMGKSCVRFRKTGDVPLELIGEAVGRVSVEDYLAVYEASRRR